MLGNGRFPVLVIDEYGLESHCAVIDVHGPYLAVFIYHDAQDVSAVYHEHTSFHRGILFHEIGWSQNRECAFKR